MDIIADFDGYDPTKSYGFGGGYPKGYAFEVVGVPYFKGVTFGDGPAIIPDHGQEGDVGQAQALYQVSSSESRVSSESAPTRDSRLETPLSGSSWIGPVLLVIAAIVILK